MKKICATGDAVLPAPKFPGYYGSLCLIMRVAEVGAEPAAEPRFAAGMSPIEALRAWMLLFVDSIATKQINTSALNAYVGGPRAI